MAGTCVNNGELSTAAEGGGGLNGGMPDANGGTSGEVAADGDRNGSGGQGAAGENSNRSSPQSSPGSAGEGGDDASGGERSGEANTAGAGGGGAENDGRDPAAPEDGGGQCAPTDEACDGVDNDCDSNVDETLTQTCGPNAVGICLPGTQACQAGEWGPCEGAVEAYPMEVCDADKLDENCDGANNEGCDCNVGETQACGKDEGVCIPGEQTCMDGKWSETCEGKVDPETPEACDEAKKDEDCDGEENEDCECIDGKEENCPGMAVGICKPGKRKCEKGKWGKCAGVVMPKDEVCDGEDNDCNGTPDNSPSDCESNQRCEGGQCRCVPNCDGKPCGDDGCGEPCPDRCERPDRCNLETGRCECEASCGDRRCGEDACGNPCGSTCERTGDGAPTSQCYSGTCSSNGQCDTDELVTCWPDSDGDRQGDRNAREVTYCRTCPADMVDNNKDCDDTDERAFEGQDEWFNVPANGGSWDFNCSNRIETDPETQPDGCNDTCADNGGCSEKRIILSESQCGQNLLSSQCSGMCVTGDSGRIVCQTGQWRGVVRCK